MGQYHLIANLDRREYIHPHRFDDGLKLLEFGPSAGGTMQGLSLLLAASNHDRDGEGTFDGNRGGGDFHVWSDPYGDGRDVGDVTPQDHELARAIVGRWAGDRIAIIGDYAEDGDIGRTHYPHVPWHAGEPVDNPWADEREEDEGDHKAVWTDISASVRRVMGLDYYTRQDMNKRASDSPLAAEEYASGDPYAILAETVS